jgi:hypothetical protein
MNCKPGDLAIIVKSVAGNEGKIVHCIKLIDVFDIVNEGPVWEVDQQLDSVLVYKSSTGQFHFHKSTTKHNHIADCCLRPIPPLDELDEVTKEIEEIA